MAGRPPRALEIDVLKAALEVFCAQGIEAPLKRLASVLLSVPTPSASALALNTTSSSGRLSPPPSARHHRQSSAQAINSICASRSWVSSSRFIIHNVLPAIELGQHLPMSKLVNP